MADIARIEAGLAALAAQLASLTAQVEAQAVDGTYDYRPVGGDRNRVALERQKDGTGAVVQRTFADGAWRKPLVLGTGYVMGSGSGPLVIGRRLDYSAQREDGGVTWFAFDPDFPGEDPDLLGWALTELPAI